ncbi:MAG: DUF308 domain-containing protein [Bacilli bacterium]|nr:DUF308 domain-containing protein [Bacilli bacterium]
MEKIAKKEPINMTSLLSAVACLVIGIILFLNKNILDIVGYIISACLGLFGLVKLLLLLKRRKKEVDIDFGEYMTVFLAIVFAIIIAIFPKSISITISIVLGTLALILGINRLILGLAIRKIDNNGSKIFIVDAAIMVLLGILIITNKFLSLLGLFMIIYALIELFSYIYYKAQNKDYSEVLNKKVSKEIKESKAIEAVIEEGEK